MGYYTYIKENEKVFEGAKDIRYFYMPPKDKSDYLVITFSGFHGRESEGIGASYNYVKPISKVNCHRLFILDDYEEGTPCYYLGSQRNKDYEVSVAALIMKIVSEYNISFDNIVTCGSSKGGTAAVYFATKYNFGHVCVGSFQLKVGTYLGGVSNYTREKVLSLIAGSYDAESINYLDNYYINFFKNISRIKPEFYIHAGDQDPHYLNHVIPFLEILENKNKNYTIELESYSNHGKVGTYYTEYLLETLPIIINENIIKNIEISSENKDIKIKVDTPKYFLNNSNITFAYYLYKAGSKDRLDYQMYTELNECNFTVSEPGSYRIKAFLRTDTEKLSEFSEYVDVKF